jgi:UrcA family protein
MKHELTSPATYIRDASEESGSHIEGPLKLSRFDHLLEKGMTRILIRNVLTTTLAIGLLGLAAQGEAASDAKQQVVTFADINMSSQAGAMTVYKRLGGAARHVCSNRQGLRLGEMQRNRACVAEAIANAVTSVNQPALTAEHLARTSRSETKRVAAIL